MTADELKKTVADAVRIGVREAVQAEMQNRRNEQREQSEKGSSDAHISKTAFGETGEEGSWM